MLSILLTEIPLESVIVPTIVGLILTIVGALIKRSIDNGDKKLEELENHCTRLEVRIKELENDFNDTYIDTLKAIGDLSIKLAEFKK